MIRPPVVQKYGGSSVADVGRLRKIAENVAALSRAGHPMVVVVSAMGKSTSELLTLAECAGATTGLRELPRRELDMLVSTGERVTMSLLAIILHGLGCPASSFTGSQSGILTTETHFDSRVVEVRPARILRALDQGQVAVVAGYQGMSRSGEITTLGRGGSDTTAVALAGALGAEACEIYSDVDGVYTSDPRKVETARHLARVDYTFMSAVAQAGARVLNARAVELARQQETTIIARSTFANGARETRVTANAVPGCRAVVDLPDVLAIRAPKDDANLVRCAARLGIELETPTTLQGFAWAHDHRETLDKLQGLDVPGVEVAPGYHLVSLVTADPQELEGAAALLGRCAGQAFDLPGRVAALIPANAALDVVRRLHSEWVEGRADSEDCNDRCSVNEPPAAAAQSASG